MSTHNIYYPETKSIEIDPPLFIFHKPLLLALIKERVCGHLLKCYDIVTLQCLQYPFHTLTTFALYTVRIKCNHIIMTLYILLLL